MISILLHTFCWLGFVWVFTMGSGPGSHTNHNSAEVNESTFRGSPVQLFAGHLDPHPFCYLILLTWYHSHPILLQSLLEPNYLNQLSLPFPGQFFLTFSMPPSITLQTPLPPRPHPMLSPRWLKRSKKRPVEASRTQEHWRHVTFIWHPGFFLKISLQNQEIVRIEM